jgi:uncharacterized protein
MNLDGEILIRAPRTVIWEALNDPDILMRCVEGCESLERIGSDQFVGVLRVQIGPIKVRFAGELSLKERNPPTSYTIIGVGKGGASGFANGKAKVVLSDKDGLTLLKYSVDARVGGKLAQVGGRLIENTTRQHAHKFFEKLQNLVEPGTRNDEIASTTPIYAQLGQRRRTNTAVILTIAIISIAAAVYVYARY